ncbi:MAG TPA: tRNA epoxyqueuosine(34) reductase QueG [Gammaproteobacteria bacterium]|nr:tRNA epoxyqueuosine(34) reductase QueG [Gammaproteobacteria bacterium]
MQQERSKEIKLWGQSLGFQQVGIASIDLKHAEEDFLQWLKAGLHGEMDYMARHGTKRSRPEELLPGTISVITVRMDYFPNEGADPVKILKSPEKAYISRYALGRDYHKMMRQRLKKLVKQIETIAESFASRVFVDSAPVMEKPLAAQSGLGWVGKHTCLINREAGSWFFLGEIYTDLSLMADKPTNNHCGSCVECIEVCPTQAIIAPYKLDARRCISYLTIEKHGSIPEEFRPLMGNRIYGCDDCLLFCPWNRFAGLSRESDFNPRHGLDCADLIELFDWSEMTFLQRMEGSPIRRIGHERWLRNIAIALGNSPDNPKTSHALRQKLNHPSEIVREHVIWALNQKSGL